MLVLSVRVRHGDDEQVFSADSLDQLTSRLRAATNQVGFINPLNLETFGPTLRDHKKLHLVIGPNIEIEIVEATGESE